MPRTVDWNTIRDHSGSRDQGFEELCSQLFAGEPPPGAVSFERRGYRDAGLECAFVMKDGSLRGMQAKYLPYSPKDDQWSQVDRSVDTALKKNPGLTHMTVCFPQNFDDPKIDGQSSAMQKWKEFKEKWESRTKDAGRAFELELWDETQLMSRLVMPSNLGKIRYFFFKEEFGRDWFLHRVEEAERNAGPRYSSALNISLPIRDLFEGLGRTPAFGAIPRKLLGKLRRASAGTPPDGCPDAAKAAVAKAQSAAEAVVRALESCDFEGIRALPVEEIARSASLARAAAWDAYHELRSADDAAEMEYRRESAERYDHYQQKYSGRRDDMREIASATSGLEQFARETGTALANRPALLLSGTAGKGKTHLFIDVASERARNGLPTIVLLGENFDGSDPLDQIRKMVRFEGSGDEFLLALESAAEAAGGRALLMVDALNEGRGMDLWPRQLAGFIKLLERHPRIGLALSVRTTYEESVVPEAAAEFLVRAEHDGFASKPEEAARAFFAFYGLNLPSVPLLNPEYTDPLFLKALCKGLQSAGMHDVPQGYEGISGIFDFLVDATEAKLRRENKIDARPGRRVVREYLGLLADRLSESTAEGLPTVEAEDVSRTVSPAAGWKDSLLAKLMDEGILSAEMMPSPDGLGRTEGVRFAYQRFGDHERARRLLDLHCTGDDPREAFRKDGPIGSRLATATDLLRARGLVEALSIQVPDRLGFELADVLDVPSSEKWEERASRMALAESLVDGLLWRSAASIGEGTFEALRRHARARSLHDRYLGILVTLCAVPGHPLNVERLDRSLRAQVLPDRDANWTSWLSRESGEGAVDRLIAWSLMEGDKGHLSDESVYLACTALAWCCASTVRSVRDRATKGLAALLLPRPALLRDLTARFAGVDDTYVVERVFAAAYAVSLATDDPAVAAELAGAAFGALFSGDDVLPHLMVRDYGRGVIERAVYLGADLPFDASEARPPYGSAMPPVPPTKAELEAMVTPNGEWTDTDRAISHVVDRFGTFDHSDLFGGPSLKDCPFYDIPLGTPVPPTRDELLARLEAGFSTEQRAAWKAYRRSTWPVHFTFLLGPEPDEGEAAEEPEKDGPIPAKGAARKGLEAVLDASQLSLLSEYESTDHDQYPKLSQEDLARWVSHGALVRGWSAERFAEPDSLVYRSYSGRANESGVETYGAKYLWMSYNEVFARLADNLHVGEHSGDKPVPYDGSWQLWVRSIDPTVIPSAGRATGGDRWWKPPLYEPQAGADHGEWLRREDDTPDYSAQIALTAPDGTGWVTLTTFAGWEQATKPEEDHYGTARRHIWSQIRGYLVRADNAQAFENWVGGQRFMGRWMPEGGDNHGYFLGEMYGSYAWQVSRVQSERWPFEEWRRPEGCPADVSPVEEGYSLEREDRSMPDGLSCFVPSPLIMREAGLRWSGRAAEWIAEDGRTAAMDPSASGPGKAALVIRRDFLDDFLDRSGYRLYWTLLGEKLVYGWDPGFPRLNMNGFAKYLPDAVEVHVTTKYEGSREPKQDFE